MSSSINIISNFKNKNILVIGDVLLDQHIRGRVSRISPEAPVPVVLQDGEPSYAPGGSANVANNLRGLGAKVTLIGKIGDDPEGKIDTGQIFVDRKTPTILKTRIMAQHQQVLRLDREHPQAPADGRFVKDILAYLRKHILDFDAVIISDYGKGVITAGLVEEVCTLTLKKRKILTVDPKVEHFSYYRGVTAITPNKNETENAIRNIKITENAGRKFAINTDHLKADADIDAAGRALLNFLNLESLLITLGERGMRLFEKGKNPVHIETRAREVFDVTGAGDTVIATFTLALTAGATKPQAADLANCAAGVVVGKMGPVPITTKELLETLKS
jgi:D-beta-D-heptose 7-phosphate kinase/D-beta-D-heptose 1-phosphate adenosyltransferase